MTRGPSQPLPPSAAGALSRREALKNTARLLAAATAATPYGCGLPISVPESGPTVKVGILHSQTGTMAISEISLRDAELMAIEEINAAGGILGRQIEPVVEDTKSSFDYLFPKKATKLLTEDNVAVVFGCWTSVSRKAVIPIFEKHNRLLFYPLQYEGNESSPNVVYTGSLPNQTILPALDWALGDLGGKKQKIYLIGSDYVYPRTANYIVKKYLAQKRLGPVGELYTPLGHADFEVIVSQIAGTNPDLILSTINGESNVAFYNALAAHGISAQKIPVLATSVGEDELRSLDPATVNGHLAAWSYFQSISTPANQKFVQRFQQEHSRERVLDDPMEAAYSAVYLWKAAVEKARSFETDAVRESLGNSVSFDAPGGTILIDPKTRHSYKRFRLGKIRADRQFDIIFESKEWIEPDPYPEFAFPGWSVDWTAGGITRGEKIVIGD